LQCLKRTDGFLSYRWRKKMYLIIVIFIGYLFGCINGAQIIGKLNQISMKDNGSKNAGATNAFVLLGWKSGVFVAFIDVFKAIISLSIVASLLLHVNMLPEVQIVLLYLNALFVVLGHNYPVTMQFNGGKGTASFLGMLLFINWKFAIIAFIIFIFFIIYRFLILYYLFFFRLLYATDLCCFFVNDFFYC